MGEHDILLKFMIKNPDVEVERLAIDSAPPGKSFDPAAVKHFLQFHGLLKKMSDSRR